MAFNCKAKWQVYFLYLLAKSDVTSKEFKALYFFLYVQACHKQVKGYRSAFLFQVKPVLSTAQPGIA